MKVFFIPTNWPQSRANTGCIMRTLNPLVEGSNPSGPTTKSKTCARFFAQSLGKNSHGGNIDAAKAEPKATGWNDGLCQDYDRGLAKWFASKLDARRVIRRGLAAPVVIAVLAGCCNAEAGSPNDPGGDFSLRRDAATGCEYLKILGSHGITPRIASDGVSHMGCGGVGR